MSAVFTNKKGNQQHPMWFFVCVCVIFFYDDKAMGTHITLSQLDAAAPESSYPLGDKPVNQPARSQTLVGHSVNVVHRVCSLVSNFISRHL